jgi:hypothetical protein
MSLTAEDWAKLSREEISKLIIHHAGLTEYCLWDEATKMFKSVTEDVFREQIKTWTVSNSLSGDKGKMIQLLMELVRRLESIMKKGEQRSPGNIEELARDVAKSAEDYKDILVELLKEMKLKKITSEAWKES